MRAASDCRPPQTARHASQPHSSTSHPPQQKDAVHSCAPARGRWPAPAQDRCAAPHGRLRATPVLRPRRPPPRHRSPTRHVPRQQQQDRRKGGHPVVSNRPLHRAMQQRCHHASASAPSPSWPPMPPAFSGQPLPGERRFSSAAVYNAFTASAVCQSASVLGTKPASATEGAEWRCRSNVEEGPSRDS